MAKSAQFDISKLKDSAVAGLNAHLFEQKVKPKQTTAQKQLQSLLGKSKSKTALDRLIEAWCESNNLELKKELIFNRIFDTTRQWRYDWAIPQLKVGIEYDGLISDKSRHLTIGGFMEDCTKINTATTNGWQTLRYHTKNYEDFLIDIELIKTLNGNTNSNSEINTSF